MKIFLTRIVEYTEYILQIMNNSNENYGKFQRIRELNLCPYQPKDRSVDMITKYCSGLTKDLQFWVNLHKSTIQFFQTVINNLEKCRKMQIFEDNISLFRGCAETQ